MKLSNVMLTTTMIICLLAIAAVAGPPLNGVYSSTDIGGVVNVGRYSESYLVPNSAVARTTGNGPR